MCSLKNSQKWGRNCYEKENPKVSADIFPILHFPKQSSQGAAKRRFESFEAAQLLIVPINLLT